MTTRTAQSRREFLKGSGALVVGFSMLARSAPAVFAQAAGGQPGTSSNGGGPPVNQAEGSTQASLKQLDSWLSIDPAGGVTVFSGKVELGTGVRTALAQIAAEELDVPFDRISMVQGDTERAPDEGYTAGSKTLQVGGVNVRKAAATARQALLEMAGAHLGVDIQQLQVQNGVIALSGDPTRRATFGELIGNQRFERVLADDVQTKATNSYTIVGTSMPRVDLLAKVTGGSSYVQDIRLPGMLHGRVVHPSGVGATLVDVDESSVAEVRGVVKVIRNGSFVGVVAEREEQAIQAARALKVTWNTPGRLPSVDGVSEYLLKQTTEDKSLVSVGDVDSALQSARVHTATFTQPYQMHASIGPSCAVADVDGDKFTVYSSTQGVYQLRGAIAQLLSVPPQNVHVVHVEGSGCYGHNGFDDVAGEAALLAHAVGRPVRVQWMRQDEHAWEPKGPAMVAEVRAALDGNGLLQAWDYNVWTPTHSTRPGGMAGNLLPGQLVDPPAPAPNNTNGGGDRNARTNYRVANNRVTVHWVQPDGSPLRPSALRSLGAMANTFANESFMDELAFAAGTDPLEFRLRHLDDPRAQAVLRAAANRFGWQPRTQPSMSSTGQGLAFAQYENNATYVATMVELTVDPQNGQVHLGRIVVGHDCGLIVNPNGLSNQIEGNVIQSASRALLERVTFDDSKVTSIDWRSSPILRFAAMPPIDVVLIHHPDQPAWGACECA
ncbi:MAG: molybdopterin cofactor-binding domain-containing protein, partial [Chloroflexota bacterium]